MLHTKSQAGRTQKSGPPATRFERHLLRRTVKLRTACERGRTGKNGERRDRTQLRDVRTRGWRVRCARTAHRGTSFQDRPGRGAGGSGRSPATCPDRAPPPSTLILLGGGLTPNFCGAVAKAPTSLSRFLISLFSTHMPNSFQLLF